MFGTCSKILKPDDPVDNLSNDEEADDQTSKTTSSELSQLVEVFFLKC